MVFWLKKKNYIICGMVKLDDWLHITKSNLWRKFTVTVTWGKLPIVLWEQRKAAACHVSHGSVHTASSKSAFAAASSNKAERVLEHEPVHNRAGLPFWCWYKGGKSHDWQLISEGCFAGNLTQCTQGDHCQSSCCYRRTTQSTELCVHCANWTNSEVNPEHEWPLIQEVNLIFPSLNKQIKPKLLVFVINIVFLMQRSWQLTQSLFGSILVSD